MHIIRGALIIEPDYQAERDQIWREGIHEASAKTVFRNRPPERVHDCVERLPGLPDLLDTQGEYLRIVGGDLLPFEIGLR